MEKNLLKQNKESWDAIADSFFGVTALPVYGCFIPTEDELGLFPVLENKKLNPERKLRPGSAWCEGETRGISSRFWSKLELPH